MDRDFENLYKVEHNENFELTEDQFRKLIEAKFARNGVMYKLVEEREGQASELA